MDPSIADELVLKSVRCDPATSAKLQRILADELFSRQRTCS